MQFARRMVVFVCARQWDPGPGGFCDTTMGGHVPGRIMTGRHPFQVNGSPINGSFVGANVDFD